MSNYKWVKNANYVELRNEDFSSIPNYEATEIDPILIKKLEENGIDYWTEGDGLLESFRYVFNAIDTKLATITAPLYEYNLGQHQYIMLSETYTDKANDPNEYEWVKETYLRCVEEVTTEQERIFEKEFKENSLDGVCSFVTISSDPYEEPNYFYDKYIPKGYIKVCEKNCSFNHFKHEVVFIKEMDAKGQAVTIKIHDLYKGLVIGKGGENIKRISKLINAKRINVI